MFPILHIFFLSPTPFSLARSFTLDSQIDVKRTHIKELFDCKKWVWQLSWELFNPIKLANFYHENHGRKKLLVKTTWYSFAKATQ